jgi:chromosome partitioning protein
MAKVLTMVSTKGGVGKTVSAVHLAAYFNGIGRTLLVDGDATRSATLWSKPGHLPFKVIPERQLSMELGESKYDFLVLDTEANPTDADLSELAAGSHLAIIPSIPDALGLHSVLQTAEKLVRFAPKTPFRVLLTIIPPKPNRDGEEAEAFLDEHRLPRFKSGIRRLVAFQRAVMQGVTVDQVDRNNLGWQDYQRIGDEAVQHLGIRVSECPHTRI